jgi:hypothetical protein
LHLENELTTCYISGIMAKKTLKPSSRTYVGKGSLVTTKVVRNAKTGQLVTVKGVGALKGSDLKIKKGLNLLEPIAEQALTRRSERRKAG